MISVQLDALQPPATTCYLQPPATCNYLLPATTSHELPPAPRRAPASPTPRAPSDSLLTFISNPLATAKSYHFVHLPATCYHQPMGTRLLFQHFRCHVILAAHNLQLLVVQAPHRGHAEVNQLCKHKRMCGDKPCSGSLCKQICSAQSLVSDSRGQ